MESCFQIFVGTLSNSISGIVNFLLTRGEKKIFIEFKVDPFFLSDIRFLLFFRKDLYCFPTFFIKILS